MAVGRFVTEFVTKNFPGAKRRGSGFMVRCPAHDDCVESLSINEDREGNILMHCFAGCSNEKILCALGCVYQSGPKRGQADWSALYTPISRERYKSKSDFERKKKTLKREWIF